MYLIIGSVVVDAGIIEMPISREGGGAMSGT